MRDRKKSRQRWGPHTGEDKVRLIKMSLCKFIKRLKRSQYFRALFYKMLDYVFWAYIMFAGLWTICWLVGEIFKKMGVG